MQSSLIAVDIGNTATSFALFNPSTRGAFPRPRRVWTIGTDEIHKSGFRDILDRRLSGYSGTLSGIVSSVVPMVNSALKNRLSKFLSSPPLFVSARLKTGVKIRYRKPAEVGADRLVNARAAIALTRKSAIVVDFGTATTFDCVSAQGEYLGGVIAPGPVISAEALYQRTARLPMVLLQKPTSILGQSTLACIQAGLYYGYRGLVKEIVARLKIKMGRSTMVFATGGQSRWILKGVEGVDRYIPHLTLTGLYLLWKDLSTS